jgi:DNA-binding NtrC family response regulator
MSPPPIPSSARIAAPAPAAGPGSALTPPLAPAVRGVILIVDDDAAMGEFLREELEHEGFAVEVASGGRAGIERVKQGGIDLVVSDVKMPDLDGLDLLREVREVHPTPYVITITAFGSIDTAIRAVKLGAFDYITKPFQIEQLVLVIEKASRSPSCARRSRAAPVSTISSAIRARCRKSSRWCAGWRDRRRASSSPENRAPARS